MPARRLTICLLTSKASSQPSTITITMLISVAFKRTAMAAAKHDGPCPLHGRIRLRTCRCRQEPCLDYVSHLWSQLLPLLALAAVHLPFAPTRLQPLVNFSLLARTHTQWTLPPPTSASRPSKRATHALSKATLLHPTATWNASRNSRVAKLPLPRFCRVPTVVCPSR